MDAVLSVFLSLSKSHNAELYTEQEQIIFYFYCAFYITFDMPTQYHMQGYVLMVRSASSLCGTTVGGYLVDRFSNPYAIVGVFWLITGWNAPLSFSLPMSFFTEAIFVLYLGGTSFLVQLAVNVYILSALFCIQSFGNGSLVLSEAVK